MDITARKTYELPDYEGPVQGDVLLTELLDFHCKCSERCKHPNVKPGIEHVGNMMNVPDDVWEKRRTEILKEMWRDYPGVSEEDALESYRNTYREDAAACFNRHGRPADGCIDYKDGSKRIGNPTRGGRGMRQALAHIAPVFLCDFCAVRSTVQGKVFHERGLYK